MAVSTLNPNKLNLFLSERRRSLKEPEELFVGSSSYDTHFLALAQRKNCDCWTADRWFWDAAKARHPQLRWVGEKRQAREEAPEVEGITMEPAVGESS